MGRNEENEQAEKPEKKPVLKAVAVDRVVARKITVDNGGKLLVLNQGDVVLAADVEKRTNQGVSFEPLAQ